MVVGGWVVVVAVVAVVVAVVVVVVVVVVVGASVLVCLDACVPLRWGGIGLGPGKAAWSTCSGEWWANGGEHVMANGDDLHKD